MTPAARIQASIEVLDEILAGVPVEKALTGWARRSRFAGSKDRAAIRDHVFDAVRCRRSFAALGGGETGRGLMIGACRASGTDLIALFSGDRHAPEPVTATEGARAFSSDAERLDIPEWLWPGFVDSLGAEAEPVAIALQHRAPVHLRVNLSRASFADAVSALAKDGIVVSPHPVCSTALQVGEGARKIAQSRAFTDGLIELQDAASQAVVEAIPLLPGMRVLDYCAGGGGKALALAARTEGVEVFAHDANPARMKDLPIRANRAEATITILDSDDVKRQAPYDVILTDVPCSGSGSWRRAPAGKWALTPDRLRALPILQSEILDCVAPLLTETATLVYATCSMLNVENEGVIDTFLQAHRGWTSPFRHRWLVSHATDGFFTAHLTRKH